MKFRITSILSSSLLLVNLISCSVSDNNVNSKSLLTTSEVISNENNLSTSFNNSVTFNSIPDNTTTASLEEKYNIQEYIEQNNTLNNLEYPIDTYKTTFTSDGGAVFSIKNTEEEVLWKRNSETLLMDVLHIEKDSSKEFYYSRYSQIIKNNIEITKSDNTFNKYANLVHTLGLSISKEENTYNIKEITPIIIRDIEKDNLEYKINSVSIINDNKVIDISSKETLLPLDGIALTSNKLKLNVEVENNNSNVLSLILSVYGNQFQLNKENNNFVGEIEIPSSYTGKGNIVLEVIDKTSLEKETKFNGYTWIIPINKSN